MKGHQRAVLLAGLFLFLWVAAVGCASKPRHLYLGPTQPEGDLVLIRAVDSYNAGLYAIDGERVYRSASVLLEPGEHELVVRVRMRRQVDLVSYEMQAFCAFYLTGSPGEIYRLRSDNKVRKSDTRGDQVSLGAQLEGGVDEKSVFPLGCG